MTGWLLDTNILFEARRPTADSRVLAFMRAHGTEAFFVSAMTFVELRYGIDRLRDLEQRTALRLWLDHVLRPQFQGRTLPASEEVLLQWRTSLAIGRQAGATHPPVDALLAATAIVHGLTVVTRDVRPFKAMGVSTLNPWEQERC